MKGLEYILSLYNMQHIELAEKLGIKKQNINLWLRDKNRNIPKKYLPVLSEIFNQPEEVFQKELEEMDKIGIQQRKIRNELIVHEYQYPDIDPKTGEEVIVYGTQVDQEQEYEDNFLEFKKNIIKLHNKIDATISGEFRNGVIDSDISLNADLFDAERLLELYETFVEIIKGNIISRDAIEIVLKGIKHYGGKSFSGDKDILAVSKLIKQIEEGKR